MMSFHQNNSGLGDFVDRIYPIELQIKDTTDTDRYFHTLTYSSKWTGGIRYERNITTKETISIFPL
jgi:hypothetical protein